MKNWKLALGVIIGCLVGFAPALAQQVIEASQGTGYGKKGPWLFGGKDGTGTVLPIAVDSTGAIKTSGGVISYMAGVPTLVTLSASTSASACGLSPGSDYEFSCSVDVAWRRGAATPTATLNDNPLRAGAIRTPQRMPTGATCLAFISSSAGYCFVSLIPTS